ncbi:MAG: hypothetical protein ACOZQL_12990 [Myxococcota bacterium]
MLTLRMLITTSAGGAKLALVERTSGADAARSDVLPEVTEAAC